MLAPRPPASFPRSFYAHPPQYDIKNSRTFLKRSPYPDLNLQDLFVGSTITVHSRQLTIASYADAYTRRSLTKSREWYAGQQYAQRDRWGVGGG